MRDDDEGAFLSMVCRMISSGGVPTWGNSGRTPVSDLRSAPRNGMPRIATLWGLLGLVAYALARSLAYARMRPLSIDEVLTHAVCRQANLPAIWKALSHGVDGQPPLFYLIERSLALLNPDAYSRAKVHTNPSTGRRRYPMCLCLSERGMARHLR